MESKNSLEMKLLKNFFEKRAKQNQDESFDPSKRELLGQIGKGIGAVAIASTIPSMLFSKDAHSRRIELPPGIANCRDPVIKDAYELYHQNYLANWGGNRNRPTKDIAIGMLNLGGDAHTFINRETPYKEPAYYFLAEKMDVGRATPSFEKIKKQNEPLAFFADAINMYFTTWVRKRKDFRWSVEERFLRSIFTAAGRPENDVKGYLRMNSGEKENFLNGCMSSLKNRSYDDKLCAAWSSFFLTSNAQLSELENNEKVMIIYNNLELPLRKISQKIRGPPFYFQKSKPQI